MLKLIIGRAGTGKSETVMNIIHRSAQNGKSSVLVVPEQTSFNFERELALRLSDELSPFAKTKNFKRLCKDIFDECGKGAVSLLNDSLRTAFIRRAILSLKDEIVYYRKHKSDAAFYSVCADVINELKNGGVTPSALSAAAKLAKSPLSAAKMEELSLIFAAYEKLLERRFRDDADELLAASRLCEKTTIFNGKTVLFDGFTGFTEPEFSILACIAEKAEEVYCTFCCDDVFSDADDSFSFVRKNARRLIALAKKRGVAYEILPALTESHRYKNNGLIFAERFFANGEAGDISADGVFAIRGENPYKEAERMADEIVRLVREEDYDYSDIAVIARDTEKYKFAVERTFELYSVPFFSDTTCDLVDSPVIRFFLSALSISGGITTEKLMTLLKTSLFDMDKGDIDELANYAFVWGVDGGGWYSEFTKSPDGLDSPTDQTRLSLIENARSYAVGLVGNFIDKAKNAAGRELLGAVYELFDSCHAPRILETVDNRERSVASSSLMLIERLYEILEDDTSVSAAELRDQLLLLASATPIGSLPPSLCEVTFGAANRMRTVNPRAVFVIGLNDGVFPKTEFDSPLLSFAEREILSESGAHLARDFEDCANMEDHFLYRAVTAPSERLYLCYSACDLGGSALSVTARVGDFLSRCGAASPEAERSPARFVVNSATALRAYADAVSRGDGVFAETLRSSSARELAVLADGAGAAVSYSVRDRSLMERCLGEKISLSSSKINEYESCPFSYFLKYIIKIKPLKKVEMSPIHAGTFVHSVVEKVMRSLGGDLLSVGEERLCEITAEISEQTLRDTLGDLINTDSRIRYLTERLKAQSSRLLLRLRIEQSQCEFKPRDFELRIAEDAEVKPSSYTTPDGKSVAVEGFIDRVDTFQKDGKTYVRVVDYKTGNKEFSLTDIFYGLNIQMLLYLFTVCNEKNNRYENAVPAAVMYMPADPKIASFDSSNPDLSAKKVYRMDGLVLDDIDVVRAMEKDAKGIFIPVSVGKDGELAKSEKLSSLERLGRIKEHIDSIIVDIACSLYDGHINACPVVNPDGTAHCTVCDYAAVCRKDRNPSERVLEKLSAEQLFAEDGKDGNAL